MKFFRGVGGILNSVGEGLAKSAVNLTSSLVAKKFPKTGEYMKDVGNSVIKSSQKVIHNTSHFADGSARAIYGAVTKEEAHLKEGLKDVKVSVSNTAKGIGNGFVYTGKSVGETIQGVLNNDKSQAVEGLKNSARLVP
ncbi:hypothetical protein [Siminovitchia sp. 179-K 8D1 HS]|uniref:hypothetical protein n=1 Tax=Siminovitchia sp. 179-K 8D1 HS TaxID=3142385 RepID=UPI0039A37885